MTRVVVAIPQPRAGELAAELALEGIEVVAILSPTAVIEVPPGAEAIIVPATRAVLNAELISACDRAGVRILALGGADSRLLGRLGLSAALRPEAAGWEVAAALVSETDAVPRAQSVLPHRVIAVWGPHGAPGRSTLAIQLAVELSRRGRRTALVDTDTVAPALALLLGLSDDAPGVAAACRRAERGALDSAELTRLATPLATGGGDIEVLPGINRPSRWPELSSTRLRATLDACREWSEETVVDVAAAFDADEEVTYDLAGPRRHAATTASLNGADLIIAVASADPLGISRFVREHAELRRLTAPTPVIVVVNQVRPGPLGIDARGQVRRTLERFAGITDVVFLPFDQRAADAALLHARPMTDVAPRSPFIAAVRRLASTLFPADAASATADSSRGSSPVVRRLRSALGARGA
ncbi:MULTISPECIES: AAA family ATPase [Microbacterium]|uniref:P-loop NTPase n=2 Tax=Microbacterium maritypicum TaxID=33918 RepID=A0ACD4B2N3_MICMQ|nr:MULTISPECIES: P-loop NTPase [Microbacterium]EYT59667.1 septum formation inhibitor-activating ATPase [Microbacterium sp. UCD-TDU]MBP5803513.1 P-loop NTPase [Microbacterium liquefaciens]UTT51671.1 P-loop NTPase [Microbacterium liquefaciens]WEF19738.1 P-loop NTPase [Microbacterium liquefaciens]